MAWDVVWGGKAWPARCLQSKVALGLMLFFESPVPSLHGSAAFLESVHLFGSVFPRLTRSSSPLLLPFSRPCDYNRGFLLLDYEDALLCTERLNGQQLPGCRKVLELAPAINQGLRANVHAYLKGPGRRITNPYFRPLLLRNDGSQGPLDPLNLPQELADL